MAVGFKSIINEYMNKYDKKTADEERTERDIEIQESPVQVESNPEDEELRRVLSTLRTNIKIVGCGGGGSNTINRIVEEGITRMENAEWGLAELEENSDTVIVIPNDKLLELVPRLPLNAAFKVADEILMKAIKGITEMVTKVGLVNLDFADLKTIMKGGGVAVIGIGESDEGNEKAVKAVEEAINSPLLEYDISSANGALICVTGGEDMTVTEAETVAEFINERINRNASIIWGAYIDPELRGAIRVMLVLVGVTSEQISGKTVGAFGEKERGYTRREERFGVQFIR
ncbi:hypothetical protein B6U90_03795 [Thermoplasmatales archaeon ex4484_6]|nr:MAG: hypothetical protein B6U90_03795 [Thermoplasmatales archaeon ex4484_6]